MDLQPDPIAASATAGDWRNALRRDGADRARWSALAALASELAGEADPGRALSHVLQTTLVLLGARDAAVLGQRGGRWQVLAGKGRALPRGASVAAPDMTGQPETTVAWLLGSVPSALRTLEVALPALAGPALLAVAVARPPVEEDIQVLTLVATLAAAFVVERPAPPRRPRRAPPQLAMLTPRERQVLALLPRGLTNRALAAELGISSGTVKTHVERILQKLGVHDRTRAAVYASQHGLSA